MAKFEAEIPYELMEEFKELEDNLFDVFGSMCRAGAEVVHSNVLRNMKKSFKTTKSLEKGLRITRVYRTPSDDGINVHIGFYGYDGIPTKRYPKGTPIPLKTMAREYGTPTEAKRPFLRKSFKAADIEQEMLKVQEKYFKGLW